MRTALIGCVATICAAIPFGAALGADDDPAAKPSRGKVIDATALGAAADGKTDDTSAIQKALDSLAETGGIVRLPAGSYMLKGHLRVPSGVTLEGVWTAPHHAMVARNTTLLATEGAGKEDGPPLISLPQSSALRGVTIHYPEQDIENIRPYPWAIRGQGMHVTVENVTLCNAYQGIDLGTHHGELHMVRNVFGCPLRRGVYVNNCTDIGRIENVHFNPHYWARSGAANAPKSNQWGKLMVYVRENLEAFVFGRTDWEFVLNTFCYGAKVGYRFVITEQGWCNGNFLGIASDGGPCCVMVDQAAPYGLLITNGEFVAMNHPEAVAIRTGEGFTGTLQLTNCAFWGPAKNIAELSGSGYVSFRQCSICDWAASDKKYKGEPAFKILGGRAHVTGCSFRRNKLHFLIGEGAKGVIISENFCPGQPRIENRSKAKVVVRDNLD